MLHLALYQPVIPPNTGTIARQCVGMNAHLHLIGPIAFDLSDHAVKRAGLDYWPYLHLTQHASPDDFLSWIDTENRRMWLVTKHGACRYDQAAYADEDVIVMGAEKEGLPEAWRTRWAEQCVSIPMPGTDKGNIRSYNLANAASLVLAQASSTADLYPA